MKKGALLICIYCICLQSIAQRTWNSFTRTLNSTVRSIVADTGDSFYIGGNFDNIGDSTSGIAYWNGTDIIQIGTPGLTNATVLSMLKFNGGLVAGGRFNYIDTSACNNIAFWDGGKWTPLGDGFNYTGATTVSTLAVYDNKLYAAGNFNLSGSDSIHNIAKWDGLKWVPLNSGTNGAVRSLCVYNGELYAGGNFSSAGGLSVNNIAKWNGTSWSAVDSGLQYTGATTVIVMREYNGNLYVGGNYSVGGGNTNGFIARWNDTTCQMLVTD
jgi:trimeric autotransporter adhesin